MDLLREKMKARGGLCGLPQKGSSSQSNPVTTNTDRRAAVSDGIGQTGDGFIAVSSDDNSNRSTTIYDNSNSSDAVVAIADAGAQIIKDSGGAVVDLAKLQTNANIETWDKTLTTGAALVDKLIGQVGDGFNLSSKVVDSFTPTETKNADIGKYAMIAAAVVAGAVLLKG